MINGRCLNIYREWCELSENAHAGGLIEDNSMNTHALLHLRRRAAVLLQFQLVLLVILLVVTGCEPGETQSGSSPLETQSAFVRSDPAAIERGRELYTVYCANCHDPEAEGYGDAVGNLQTLPADLTRLSENNGGEFPVEYVQSTIDGRVLAEAHGPREMPVWGNVWPEESSQKSIDDLIAFLNSIQK